MGAASAIPPKLGEGLSRKVFARGRRQVWKVAKNEAGRLQNLAEAVISLRVAPSSPHLGRVTQVADFGNKIIMERVSTAPPAVFARRLGMDFERELIRWTLATPAERRDHPGRLPAGVRSLLTRLIRHWGVAPDDLARCSNWGLRRRGQNWVPVLIDYGLVARRGFFRRHRTTLASWRVSE